ncbi:hypothetical protein [Rhodococcus sp. O3]|uniref:hypothetical protein n=1 Tax=Rhodococcus sp. O3 TaxID=3404919 RepID=UPI003B66E1F6
MTDRTVAERAESLRNDLGALDRRVGDLVESLEVFDREDMHGAGESARREMLDLLSDARLDLHAARDHIGRLVRYASKFDL